MKFVPVAVTTKVARTLLKTKKSSPTIMFAAGVIGMVGTVVLASKATLKLEEVMEEIQENLDIANTLKHSKYNEEERSKDKAYIYGRSVVKLGKLYGPPVLLGVVSIGLLAGSHTALTRRNAGLTAAYAAVDQAFREYRARVVGELGEDKDLEFRYGFELCDIDSDDGKKSVAVKRAAPGVPSGYARFFDETSSSWESNAEFNLIFVRCQQQYFNDKLYARGHVLLNEVYDRFGIPRTMAGCVVGWLKDGTGDGFIDFGVFDANNDKARDFVNGYERGILLDFNVDGSIYDKI